MSGTADDDAQHTGPLVGVHLAEDDRDVPRASRGMAGLRLEERTVRVPAYHPAEHAARRTAIYRGMVGGDRSTDAETVGSAMDLVMTYLGPRDRRALHVTGLPNHGARNPELMMRVHNQEQGYEKALKISRILGDRAFYEMLDGGHPREGLRGAHGDLATAIGSEHIRYPRLRAVNQRVAQENYYR